MHAYSGLHAYLIFVKIPPCTLIQAYTLIRDTRVSSTNQLDIKQGYAFKNWVEGLSDEAQSSRLAENCIFSLVSSNLPFDISLLSTFHRNAQFESKRRILKKVPCQK